MFRHFSYRRAAGLAGVVAVVGLPLAAGVAHAGTTHAHPHVKPPHTTGTRTSLKKLKTTADAVNIRTQPGTATTSHVVGKVRKAGTSVTVSCYVTGQRIMGDRIWYRTAKPAGDYLSGYYLNTGHEPAAGVAPCANHHP